MESSEEKKRTIFVMTKSAFKKKRSENGIAPQDMTPANFELYVHMLKTYGQNVSLHFSGTPSDFELKFILDVPKYLKSKK